MKTGGAGVYVVYPDGTDSTFSRASIFCCNYSSKAHVLSTAAEIIISSIFPAQQIVFLTTAMSVLQAHNSYTLFFRLKEP